MWRPDARISWNDESVANAQIRAAFRTFLERQNSGQWTIYWCAGKGTMDGVDRDLAIEKSCLESLLAEIASANHLQLNSGLLVYCSSAGGVYGSQQNDMLTEFSEVRPYGAYGIHKLQCEDLISHVSTKVGLRVAICRITSAFGPRQDLNKQQGLISTIVRFSLQHKPVTVYVPLDTTRNFIYADDVASVMISTAKRLHQIEPQVLIKLIASPRNITIATVLRECQLVLGKPVRYAVAGKNTHTRSPHILRFQSKVFTDLDSYQSTPFAVGIHRVLSEQLRQR